MLRRGAGRRGARLPRARASPAATGSTSRSSRSTGSAATSGGEHAGPAAGSAARDWLRTKQRVKKAVDDLAEELLELYAARAGAEGHAFPADTPWQHELEASVPVRGDARPAAGDRRGRRPTWNRAGRWTGSSCGDVGYGKTEVAMRAAFKAVQDGQQVAVLVPTTVLAAAALHARSRERFAAFPVTVELLVALPFRPASSRPRSPGWPTARSTS